MSNVLPPLQTPAQRTRAPSNSSNVSHPPLADWSERRCLSSSFSSSPPRSSPPPKTPFSSRSHNHAYIRSSPAFDSEFGYNSSVDYIDELPPIWHHRSLPTAASKQTHTNVVLPGLKDIFSETALSTRSAQPSVSTNLSAATMSPAEPSFGPSYKHPGRHVPVFCESEEEGEGEGYSLVEEDSRATFFRISAERGQWKYDPLPFKPQSRSFLRKSAPTSSPPPISGLQLLSRPISEPAPSMGRQSTPPMVSNSHEEDGNSSEIPSSSYVDTISSDQFSPATDDAPHSLPSLTSDRESIEPEDMNCPSSPLPPSSPPLSSPPATPVMHSIFLDIPDGEMQTDELAVVPTLHLTVKDQPELALARKPQQNSDEGSSIPIAPSSYAPQLPSPVLAPTSLFEISLPSLINKNCTISNPSLAVSSPNSSSSRIPDGDEPTAVETTVMEADLYPRTTSPDADADVDNKDITGIPDLDDKVVAVKRMEVMSTQVISSAKGGAEFGTSLAAIGGSIAGTSEDGGSNDSKLGILKEKRKNHNEAHRDGPLKKKPRVSEEPDRHLGPVTALEPKKRPRKQAKRRLEVQEEEENKPAPKKQHLSDHDTSKRFRNKSASASGSKSSSAATHSKNSPSTTDSSKLKLHRALNDPETRALDAEVCGMLIESMATSRASCLPASTLYKNVMQSHPSLKGQRSDEEWVETIERVLHDGEASKGTGVFGKVESSFKDESGRPLEVRWFYVPELDEDQERATLIRSMMPRPGKRSETKKYKQYYYRPLDKISRWDSEDAI